MSNIATTIEQIKHLLELGLDPKTADMCWVKDYTGQWVLITDTQINIRSRLEGMYEYSGFQWQEHIALVPSWSLSALLEVMPSEESKWCTVMHAQDFYWCTFEKNDGHILKEFCSKNYTDAAYEMVCWLLENNLIKKGGQDGD